MNYMVKPLIHTVNIFRVEVLAVALQPRLRQDSVMLPRATMLEVQFVGPLIAMVSLGFVQQLVAW
jgi:hypothetical protein